MFMPAFASTTSRGVSATTTGPVPATVTGATATIDYPVLAGLSTSVTRTIYVSNPIGNPSINSISISVPKAAASVAPTGTFPADSGVPGSPTVLTYGSGPWAIVYSAGSGAVLVPGGSTIKITLTFTTETALATAGVADSYPLSVSVTDTTTATTSLSPITVYETSSTAVTVSGATPASPTAGTIFTVSVSGVNSGVPLVATAAGTVSGSPSTTTVISPATFPTGSSATSLSVNDTQEETVTITVSGGTKDVDSSGGLLTGSSAGIVISAGAVTSLAIVVKGVASGHIYNVTRTDFGPLPGIPIPGSGIAVSTADKFGNPAVFSTTSATSVTVAVTVISGQPAGFSSAANFGTSYPYNPTPALTPSVTVTIPASASTVTLATVPTNFFYGIDYGSQSQLTATAPTTGLTSGVSATIKTYSLFLGGTASAISVSTLAATAGGSVTLTGTLPPTVPAQAGVPLWFFNTTDYSGKFANGLAIGEAFTTVSSGVASASITLTAPTVAGVAAPSSTRYNVKAVVASAAGTLANGTASANSGLITTVAGAISKLTVKSYFTSALAVQTYARIPNNTLFLNIQSTDQYGNPAAVTGDTQLTLASTSGTLSITTVRISATHTSTSGSGFIIQFTAPAIVGTKVNITATGGGWSGYDNVTVVSATPNLTVNAPATVTSGVPSMFTGVANASTGISGNTIALVQYSVNGAANVTVASPAVANYAYSFSVLLSATSQNTITVYVKDSATTPNWNSITVQVPQLQPAQRFNFTSAPAATSVQGQNGVSSTIKNNAATSLTANVYFVVSNAKGQTVAIYLSQVTLASGASSTQAVALVGFAAGTYTVNVFVWDANGAPASASPSVNVTIS